MPCLLPSAVAATLAGVAAFIKQVRPEIKVIGVQTVLVPMKVSVAAGRRVELKDVGLFTDGTAVKLVGEETFRICHDLLDDIITVDTDAVCSALKDIFDDTRSICEPSSALALAGLKLCHPQRSAKPNADCRNQRRKYEFSPSAPRFRAQQVGEEQQKRFLPYPSLNVPAASATTFQIVSGRNITEFNYRYGDDSTARHLCRHSGCPVQVEPKSTATERSGLRYRFEQ